MGKINSTNGKYLNLTEPKPKDLIRSVSQFEGKCLIHFYCLCYDDERRLAECNQDFYFDLTFPCG